MGTAHGSEEPATSRRTSSSAVNVGRCVARQDLSQNGRECDAAASHDPRKCSRVRAHRAGEFAPHSSALGYPRLCPGRGLRMTHAGSCNESSRGEGSLSAERRRYLSGLCHVPRPVQMHDSSTAYPGSGLSLLHSGQRPLHASDLRCQHAHVLPSQEDHLPTKKERGIPAQLGAVVAANCYVRRSGSGLAKTSSRVSVSDRRVDTWIGVV
ncbi:hypothetical protein C2E23DRAFT_469463 [Lenzites betulinus]|nr:hypothetical protein C2E23DRAFT_469463 [Lenzites betulinus]